LPVQEYIFDFCCWIDLFLVTFMSFVCLYLVRSWPLRFRGKRFSTRLAEDVQFLIDYDREILVT